MRPLIIVATLFLFASTQCRLTRAIAQESAGERPLKENWRRAYQSIADSFVMYRGQIPLSLHEQALLYYTNPVRANDQHGAVFLWTESGRPAVVGSIWSAINRQDSTSRNVTHEWHSLVEDPLLRTLRKGEVYWSAGEPGISWQVLTGTPNPAQTRAGRLLQMRDLARRVTARIVGEEKSDLRLMPQPLYRYPEMVPEITDGALFAFSLATDPELLLLTELSATDQKSVYHVAFARFGNLAMEVRDGDRTIWTCERGAPGRSDGKYFLRWRAEQMPAETTPAQPMSKN